MGELGMSGPKQGLFSVELDNITIGQYMTQSTSVDCHRLLFAAHDLIDGLEHQLSLTNDDEEGGSLVFDVAYIHSIEAFTA